MLGNNKELGKYLLDVSKYFLTTVFAASLLKDLSDAPWLVYLLSGSVALLLLVCGLILTKDKDKDDDKQNNNNNNKKDRRK